MLFDLQGRRKTAIKAIYLALAVLLGGGLVLFGVGSNVNGGLADIFGGSTTGAGQYEEQVEKAEAKVAAQPKNATAYEQLIRARYSLAGAGDNYSQETNDFSAAGKAILTQVGEDWNAYLKIVNDEPDPLVANFAVQAFVSMQDAKGALKAQQAVAASREEAADYLAVFQYALASGDERISELAERKAIKLADMDDVISIKNQIKELKKTYKDAQKNQINEQVQEQINQQIGQGGGGLGGLGGGLGGGAPAGGQ